MLRAKLTDRAFSVIQAILKDQPHDYDSIKETLLDHFHDFRDFNELVASTRVYASRLEALETDREKQEFIRSIDGSHDNNNAELKELKQMVIDQKEMVNEAVANIRHEKKAIGEKKTESEQIRDGLNELVQSVNKIYLNKKNVSYPSNESYKK
ncbi:hypothetical protein OUZ56_010045 [Daphnia magna]|uniref:Uncharacterized protein n=1 Tax=Daphnia magna TaxID=35525 RepID=A0ABR0AHM7_9CRUS|nr:hypothetical protein OUZ56_010045 [Daphnia magna]